MSKRKTSFSLEYDRLERLRRLAQKERRSVSQLVDLALDHLLPLIDDDNDLSLESLTGQPSNPFQKPKGQGITPVANASRQKASPHSALRIPHSELPQPAAAPAPEATK